MTIVLLRALSNSLEKLVGKIKKIQEGVLLKLVKIVKRDLAYCGDMLSLGIQRNPPVNNGVKTS